MTDETSWDSPVHPPPIFWSKSILQEAVMMMMSTTHVNIINYYFVVMVVLLVSLSNFENNVCLGFVQKPTFKSTGLLSRKTSTTTSYTGKDAKSTFSTTTTTTTTAMNVATISADLEAEVLTTMAHVTMDFTGLASPSKSLLRMFTVIGRIMVISADYICDNTIHPEELVIQLFLMSVAIKDMIVDTPTDTVTPTTTTTTTTTDETTKKLD
ncbi:hypothetical protein FRACYDRAFT_240370 [Fragilariopsis cylindrus CCMP1102]|uniref:Uncharacterized protein n=1 Tax=Fragilariopsis cylindrus CCMP1102 TaxID=635003 RepID=A0A1E7FBZ1_9STRA|nr:hypothetical protein FRACYDRAFT_240370 [Fragilariopsis cylindrus CCMP1102]|eukprot:OEU15677.1 hypothetical protein FRACYDRAFT_240370 [Fragilariopsis cylindrus CCMP1102]